MRLEEAAPEGQEVRLDAAAASRPFYSETIPEEDRHGSASSCTQSTCDEHLADHAGVEEPDHSRRSTAQKGYTMDELHGVGRDVSAQAIKPYITDTTRVPARGAGGGQVHPLRGAARRAARPRLRHLSLYDLLERPSRRMPASAPACRTAKIDRGGRCGEGVLLLRRRGAVHVQSGSARRPSSCERRAMSTALKTGRPRRVGPIDLVATRYGVQMQGATEHRPDEARRAELYGEDPPVRPL